MVNTKKAMRRAVRFGAMVEIGEDLTAIEAADAAGTLSTTGNWSAGQVCEHVAIFGECALDGFASKPPAVVRWLVILLFKKKALSGAPLKPGLKLPSSAGYLLPGDDTTLAEGAGRLRVVLGRVAAGERFTHASPIFGELTHEQWTVLQLGHASMHMSFLGLGSDTGG